MKLSASSRDYVAEQVRNEFEKDLRAADKALEEANKAAEDRYGKFEKDLLAMSKGWIGEIDGLAKKHGLHWAEEKGPAHGAYVEIHDCESTYRNIDRDSFAETSGHTPEIVRAKDARRAIIDGIGSAVQKALFEIEVHGKKDTLQEIVDRVIAGVRTEVKDK